MKASEKSIAPAYPRNQLSNLGIARGGKLASYAALIVARAWKGRQAYEYQQLAFHAAHHLSLIHEGEQSGLAPLSSE